MGVDVSRVVSLGRAGSRQVTGADRPRVLHLVPALFGREGIVGGAERYAFELARHMADAVPTRLVTFGERADERAVGGLAVRVLANGWAVRGQQTNRWSPSVIGEIVRADVVHCHQQHILMSSTAAAVCRLIGHRVFATELGGGGWDISAYASTDGWFHGHLHISEYSRTIYGHAHNPRARVIMGGVDTDLFTPDAATPRNGAVLFVGRLLPHKGVLDLIEALPDGMALEIVGPSNDTQYYERIRERARDKNVRFRHDCDDRVLIEAYRRAACVVLPSVYRAADGTETLVPELLGQTLLEAMACGAPVVCTRVASLPEIVEEGETGFVVNPGDPSALGARLTWIATHPKEAAAMGAAGRRTVLERFQWREVVRRCLDAYESVQ